MSLAGSIGDGSAAESVRPAAPADARRLSQTSVAQLSVARASVVVSQSEFAPLTAVPGAVPDSIPGAQPAEPSPGGAFSGLIPDLAVRFPLAARINEPTWIFWISALCFVSLILFGLQRASEGSTQMPGQDAEGAISVTIVEDPDKTSQTKLSASGTTVQTANPELPPQPEQPPSPSVPDTPNPAAVPPEPVTEPAPPVVEPPLKPTEKPVEKPQKAAQAPADFALHPAQEAEISLESLQKDIARLEQQQERQERQAKPAPRPSVQHQATISGGRSGSRGGGATGRSSAYDSSIIAALTRSKPPPFAYRGEVLVAFMINAHGGLAYLRIVHSSGELGLDQAALAAIRRAHFEPPPPALNEDERTWLIDYVFE